MLFIQYHIYIAFTNTGFLGIGNITSLGFLFIVFAFIFDTIYLWFMLQVRALILLE